jgi:hypothetical protein
MQPVTMTLERRYFMICNRKLLSAVFALHMNYVAIVQYVIEKRQSVRKFTYVCSNYNFGTSAEGGRSFFKIQLETYSMVL